MLRSTECFRRSIRTYFGQADVDRRRALAEIILDWVFGTKAQQRRAGSCCDACDAERITKIGWAGYVARTLGGRL
jgi:ATP-dependent DNA helicase RecQ